MAKFEKRDAFLASDINVFDLQIGYAELRLVEKETDQIEVVAILEEEKAEKYDCEATNGTLKLNAGKVDVRVSIFGEDKTFHKEEAAKDIITIMIPKGMKLEKLHIDLGAGTAKLATPALSVTTTKIEVGAGKFMAEGLLVEDSLDVNTGAGVAELCDFSSKKANVECGVGSMKLKGAVDGDIHVNCGVGAIEMDLDAVENDYSYKIDCAIGSVIINGNKRGGLFASKNTVASPNAKGTIHLSCGVGKIELHTRKKIG